MSSNHECGTECADGCVYYITHECDADCADGCLYFVNETDDSMDVDGMEVVLGRYATRKQECKNGNRIWYDALPSSLWNEREQYQNDHELDLFSRATHVSPRLLEFSTVYGFSSPAVPVSIHHAWYFINRCASYPAHYIRVTPGIFYDYRPETQTSPAQIFRVPAPSQAAGQWMQQYAGNNLLPIIQQRQFVIEDQHHLVAARKPVKALGLVFEPCFNYKREIFGHIQRGERCYVCLTEKHLYALELPHFKWGLRWCDSCMDKYTFHWGDIYRAIPNAMQFLRAVRMERVHTEAGATRYYRPEIDDLTRQQFGVDLKAKQFSDKAERETEENVRVQRSALEGRRREVRLKIVEYAKMIWDGHDPDPDLVTEGDRTFYRSRAWLSSSQMYARFRTRFAPTSDLAKFLFHERLLSDHPESVPVSTSTGWLEDPTKALPRATTVRDLTTRWISDAAEKMCLALTEVFHLKYHKKGLGGYVSEWRHAAKKYHIHRLEDEVNSGMVVKLEFVPIQQQHWSQYDHIRALRVQCELHGHNPPDMLPLPPRPETSDLPTLSDAQFMRHDLSVLSLHEDRHEKIQSFNKIISATCTVCPISDVKFNGQGGVEKLVDHMFNYHRLCFWLTDEFHVMG